MRAVMFCGLSLCAALTACATDEATDATEPGDEPGTEAGGVIAPDGIDPEARSACPDGTLYSAEEFAELQTSGRLAGVIYSAYFHPNNGSHGGWIESWRLCDQGGGQFQICTGGYAPVYFWNQPCTGNVSSFYPQGWHGWVQTFGGCG